MAYIKINQDKVNQTNVKALIDLCPFNAFDYIDAYLSINAACKMCKLCITKGPEGVCEWVETRKPEIDKKAYRGWVVLIEHHEGIIHPVGFELIGKARELAGKTGETVMALLLGHQLADMAKELLMYGVDAVHVYDDPRLEPFNVELHTRVVEAFFKQRQVNIILVGGTTLGRSYAPRIAARLKTGLTADCTMLDVTKEGDLLQIRPAFGGNIMAKIHTPAHRPQLATIRYKMFERPTASTPSGNIIFETMPKGDWSTGIKRLAIKPKPAVDDIADADVIIAVGRAFKTKKDLALIEPLRKRLDAMVACTRPLIENGWFDPRRQIGLSGRTVKPRLIINLGISGAVQYIEGMKGADLIISVNHDPDNKLFDISHYAIVGDVYDVLPSLNLLLDQLVEERT